MKLINVPWVQMPPEGLGTQGHNREVSANAVRDHLAPSAFENSGIRVPIFLSASERAHTGCPKEMVTLCLASWVVAMSFLSGNLDIKSAEHKQKCGLASWSLWVLCFYFFNTEIGKFSEFSLAERS